jgi:PAS domain S-box-containing protein
VDGSGSDGRGASPRAAEPGAAASVHADALFREHRQRVYTRTDEFFVTLMVAEWAAAILAAHLISPLAWAGRAGEAQPHLLIAIVVGGAITAWTVFVGGKYAGRRWTRHSIAAAQMLMAALLVHLTAGRIETHFVIFGSLAFLAFYRDVTVFPPAAIVVVADHVLRGVYWPDSAYDLGVMPWWRSIEDLGWIAFVGFFIAVVCLRSRREMRSIAAQRAEREIANETTEAIVRARTRELAASESRFRTLSAAAPIGIFESDLSGQATYFNARWGEIAGMPPEEGLGSGWIRTVHRDDRQTLLEQSSRALRENLESSHDFRIETTTGLRWVHARTKPVRAEDGTVTGHIGTMEDVTDRKRVEEELRCSERRLALQYAVARVLAECETFAEAGPRILQTICESVGWDAGLLWRMDEDERMLRCQASWHAPAAGVGSFIAASRARAFAPGRGLPGRIWAEQAALWIPDVQAEPDYVPAPIAAGDGLRAAFGFPIVLGGEIVAVMEFYSHDIQQPDAESIQTLTTLGAHVGQFIERQSAKAAHAQEAQATAALAQVGRELVSSLETRVLLERLCEVTTAVLGCGYISAWMHQPEHDVYVPIATYGFPIEEAEIYRTLRAPAGLFAAMEARLTAGKLVFVTPDTAEHPAIRAMLERRGTALAVCIPLRNRGKLIGVLIASYPVAPAPFDVHATRIADGISQLASMALTNARLVEEIEDASRLKSEFVSTMSHELRTPINVILGYAEMLEDEPAEQQRRQLLASVRRSSLELLELVEATLDMNRIASGTDVPRREMVPIDDLVADLAAEFGALPRTSDVEVRWPAAHGVALCTDRRKLKAIVKNLVGNARKFTPTGTITVGCEPTADGAVLTVRDTGIGMAREHLPFIFDIFRQVDSSDSRSYAGAGLGLYIVHTLVTQLEGRVEVESELGIGSTFRVILPDATAPRDGVPELTAS